MKKITNSVTKNNLTFLRSYALTLFLFSLLPFSLSAQVTIGADVAPKPFSVLELMGQYETGTYGGLRLPQLTTVERDAIMGLSSPDAKGLTIYNTTTNCIEFWNGTAWKSLCDGGGGSTTDDPGSYGGKECGAYIAPGVWKKFMCRNLGADPNANPITPSDDLNGDYFLWGSRTPAATLNTIINTTFPWTIPAGWYGDNSTATDAKVKSLYDPCPAGYRVPTYDEWNGVINNNTKVWISAGDNSGYMVGNLFLPAAGGRNTSNGALLYRGTVGYYWSSRMGNAASAYYLGFDGASAGMYSYSRTDGQSVRCIAE
jgi:hypothetical protein